MLTNMALLSALAVVAVVCDAIYARVYRRRRAQLEKTRYTIELSGVAKATLEKLAAFSGGSKIEVLRKLIALLEVVAEAQEKGEHLVLADKNNEVVHTIVGL